MSFRKLTKKDVETAYGNAAKAKQSALKLMQQARQLKDGADKMKAQFKKQGGR
ncbi:MAG: hypothetical protein HFE40_01410 [Clostridia bacterium]|nr:hypothetical protein [Clostridia bacterium]